MEDSSQLAARFFNAVNNVKENAVPSKPLQKAHGNCIITLDMGDAVRRACAGAWIVTEDAQTKQGIPDYEIKNLCRLVLSELQSRGRYGICP